MTPELLKSEGNGQPMKVKEMIEISNPDMCKAKSKVIKTIRKHNIEVARTS